MDSVSFYVKQVGSVTARNLQLYLLDTDASDATYTGEALLDSAQLVYSGTVNVTKTGWKKVSFQNIFSHDPAKNLMVICVDQTASAVSEGTDSFLFGAINYINYYAYCICDQDAPTVPGDGNDHGSYTNRSEIRLGAVDPSKLAVLTLKANGGEVRRIELAPDRSTTGIIERIGKLAAG